MMRMRPALAIFLPFILMTTLCMAQTPAPDGSELSPFLGRWVGQYEECSGSTNCENRSVEMTVSIEEGQPTIELKFGPAGVGFQRYSKASKGPVIRKYPAQAERRKDAAAISYTAPSGTKVVFQLSGNKLIGSGTGGRFTVNYRLQKDR